MTTKRSKLVSLSDEPILRKQVLKDLAALKRKITVTLRKIARLNRKPQVTTKRSKKPVSLCVFGKPALSRILGLFPGGFAATTSG